MCRLYDQPYRAFLCEPKDGVDHRAFELRRRGAGTGRGRREGHLRIKERLPRDTDEYTELPVALTPDQPLRTTSSAQALADLAAAVAGTLPRLPRQPALDLLRRRPPRLAGGLHCPQSGDHPDRYIDAITAAVAALDHSYLAVQGPPGTGKTYVGSHVIARLVARGWKVGVVGQSHAVVENMLPPPSTRPGCDRRRGWPRSRTATMTRALDANRSTADVTGCSSRLEAPWSVARRGP